MMHGNEQDVLPRLHAKHDGANHWSSCQVERPARFSAQDIQRLRFAFTFWCIAEIDERYIERKITDHLLRQTVARVKTGSQSIMPLDDRAKSFRQCLDIESSVQSRRGG